MEPSTTVGREGTHENPEKLENVPGHVVPISTAMSTSSTPSRSASRGDVDETEFIGFRLNRATRVAPARRMIRGKVPFGGEAIRELSDSGLSSREGCGTPCANVIRRSMGRVCDYEPFDLTPDSGAYLRCFVRHPTTQLMPRKVKTASNGGAADRAITDIHDIASPARPSAGCAGRSPTARRARSATTSSPASARRRSRTKVHELAMPVEFGLESMSVFIAWTQSVLFHVVRSEGECAV